MRIFREGDSVVLVLSVAELAEGVIVFDVDGEPYEIKSKGRHSSEEDTVVDEIFTYRPTADAGIGLLADAITPEDYERTTKALLVETPKEDPDGVSE